MVTEKEKDTEIMEGKKERKEKRTLGYRTDDDVRIAIEAYFRNQGIEPGNVWSEVLKLIKKHKLMEEFPEHTALLEAFTTNNKRSEELFLAMLALAKSAKEQSMQECKSQMDSKDTTIIELQKKLAEAVKEKTDLMKVNCEINKENLRLKSVNETLKNENNQLHLQVQKLETLMMENLKDIGDFVKNAVQIKEEKKS